VLGHFEILHIFHYIRKFDFANLFQYSASPQFWFGKVVFPFEKKNIP